MKKWWLIHDPSQGHSAQIDLFAAALETALKSVVSTMWVTDDMTIEGPDEPEGIIFWCGLRWYVRNRAALPGRPWIGALSWCFDDLMGVVADKAVPGINLIDAGIDALWTNCPAYVQQTSAAYQCTFSLKPFEVQRINKGIRYPYMGAVLPNVKDRDFSQLWWTLKHLKRTMGKDFNGATGPKIFLNKGSHECLPLEIVTTLGEENIIRVKDQQALEGFYDTYQYMINVPRITDIRGGVVPPEIYQALCRGCVPLVISHPVWAKQLTGLPTFKSLTEYGAVLDQIVNGTAGPMGSKTPHLDCSIDSHHGMAWKIAQTYKESAHATAG